MANKRGFSSMHFILVQVGISTWRTADKGQYVGGWGLHSRSTYNVLQVNDHLGFLIVIICSHSKKNEKFNNINNIEKIIKENAKKN